MGARRHGQEVSPGNVVKCLCISSCSHSVDQLFSQFLGSRIGSFSSFGLCFELLRAMTEKDCQLFEEKVHPRENPVYTYKFAHPWKKNPVGAHALNVVAVLHIQIQYS